MAEVLQSRYAEWKSLGECHGLMGGYPFYPAHDFERNDQRELREARAKAICGECVVKEVGLEAALAYPEVHGI